MRNVYRAVTNTPSSTLQYARPAPGTVDSCTASMMLSLEKKPAKPGKPIKASAPSRQVQ